MTRYTPPPVSSKYGAPMGRPSNRTYTDKNGVTYELDVTEDARPFHLERVRINSGGYDSGGAYWGLGAPLYRYEGPLGDIYGHVRAATRAAAKAAVIKMFPKARFYR